MRRLVLWLIAALALALAAGLWLGRLLLEDAGYVLVVYGQREMETSVTFLVLVLVAAAALLVLLTLLMAPLWRLLTPTHWSVWRRRQAAQRQLRDGLLELSAGHWQRAHGLLSSAGRRLDWPLPAWLAAAVAARQRGDGESVQQALAQAEAVPSGRFPTLLVRARMALQEGRPHRARELLEPERKRYGDSPVMLHLLAEAYGREGNWAALCELLPQLRKVDPQAGNLDQREQRAWLGRMRQAASMPGFNNAAQRRDSLARLWKKMPQRLRRVPSLRAQYAGYLAQFGDGPGAFKVVTRHIEEDWDDGLVAVMEALEEVPPDVVLARLERWLVDRPANQAVLLTAGRVALKAKLWGKARAFFETAAAAGHATAQAELARLLAALGDEEGARACLDARLEALGATLPPLPQPRPR
ncbi:heme biosynthesis protein HemY [Isoalcanivorax indicus]|uniref:heme biosynthesis protein HemY n=1 Tax=Isoalcanivorax indicus TaxID=2202653 RepID=UPI000DBA0F32|nr:heme biosynthesis HemY N-terminal domain-containing protein [Isoalcanivorax indicus]